MLTWIANFHRFSLMLFTAALILCTPLPGQTDDAVPPADDKYVVSYIKHPHVEKFVQLVEKSYADIGIQISLLEVEGERGIDLLNKGYVDADVIRFLKVVEEYDDIILVEPALSTVSLHLVCNPEFVCDDSVFSDQNITFLVSIGTVRAIPDELRQDIKGQFYFIERYEIFDDILKLGRFDYALYASADDGNLPADIALHLKSMKINEGSAYHIIHKKHADLIPALTQALFNNLQKIM